MSSDSSIAMILLAAGGSARMGTAKQLLIYRNQTFLRHAAEQAIATGCSPVIVVLGSQAPRMKAELLDLKVQTIENPIWQRGIGTSIRAGLSQLPADTQAVILGLCDQPLLGADGLRLLLDAYRDTGRPIIAARYADTVGVPAFFTRRFFPALAALPDDAGAKQLLQTHAADVLPVPLDPAATDIDSPEDFHRLP